MSMRKFRVKSMEQASARKFGRGWLFPERAWRVYSIKCKNTLAWK
jgi:hypothetical protein